VSAPPAALAIRPAAPADVGEMGVLLAEAFCGDPVAAYLFPDAAARASGLRRFFALQLRHSYLPRGEAWVASVPGNRGLRGAALWSRPDVAPLRVADIAFLLQLAGIFTTHLPAARRLGRMLALHHPRRPHWYLGTIGVEPAWHRRGVGSALVGPVLARCDADNLPAYLECSREENVAFYARHGFACSGEVRLPGGPPLWLMWRVPRR
jgi:GNAT superfamily N-acetyltransferase